MANLVEAIPEAVHGVVPDLLIEEPRVLSAAMTRWSEPFRLRMIFVVALACLATSLTSVGVYAVVSYVVSSQAVEVGLRRAMGASVATEVRRVARAAVGPVLEGAALGLVAGLVVARLSVDVLFGVAPLDPPSYVMALASAVIPAALAAAMGASRVLVMDPVRVLDQR